MPDEATDHFILFSVAQTSYAIHTAHVQELDMIEQVTRVPNTVEYVDGLVSVRGRAVPIVNVRRRFGFERIPYDVNARLIVVSHGGRIVGLAVDSAREFVRLDTTKIEPAPDMHGNAFIEGLVNLDGRLVLVIDVGRVIAAEDETAAEGSH